MIRKKVFLGLLLLSSCMVAQKALEDGSTKEIVVDESHAHREKKEVKTEGKETTSVEKKEKVKKENSAQKVEKVGDKKKATKKKSKDQVVTPQDVITVVENPRVLHNKIVLRIPSAATDGAKDIVITERMLHTKSLEGRTRSKAEVIFEYCVYDKAVNGYHMTPSRHEAEQHIESLKTQYGLGQKDIEKLFKESGMTYEEGVEQLVMFYTNRAFTSNLLSSKVLVTEQEIKKYHQEHPEVVPTSYKIEKAFVEKDSAPEEAIENLRKYGLGQDNLMWQPAYWIAEEDLVESKKFITKMHEGVVKVVDSDNNWEVVRLHKKVEQHTKPLTERYREITEKLQQEKFQEKFDQFKKDLLKEYNVVEVA